MIEYRSLQRVAFLMMVTLGLYFFFWFHGVSRELLAYNGRKGSPGLWVFGFGFVFTFPILVMIPIWKLAQQVSAASEGKYSTFFLVTTGIFIVPLIYLTQKLLNDIALEQMERGDSEESGEAPAGVERRGEVPAAREQLDEAPPVLAGNAAEAEPDEEPFIESEDIRTVRPADGPPGDGPPGDGQRGEGPLEGERLDGESRPDPDDEPDAGPHDEPDEEPFIESEDIRTIGR